MSTSVEYTSYLLRLWREARADTPESMHHWHSEIEHIQTGQHWAFDTLDEMLNFLRRQTGEAASLNSPVDPRMNSLES